MKTRITVKTKAVTLFLAFKPSLENNIKCFISGRTGVSVRAKIGKAGFQLFYFDLWKEDDFQRLRSMMIYMMMMKLVGMAKEVIKKLIWNPAKL